MEYKIYCDSEVEAQWFKSLCLNKLEKSAVFKIGRRGENPSKIDNLISYDRPDIILLYHDEPILVVEKTREVPTGHNVGQRFARLTKAAENGIPSIYFLPYFARKHGKFENICQMNPRVLLALINMSKLHRTTSCTFQWPANSDGELIDDGTEDTELKSALHFFLDNNPERENEVMLKQLNDMEIEYTKRLKERNSYAEPPASIEFKKTNLTTLRDSTKKALEKCNITKKRDCTLVYTIEMNPKKCKRQDPYTGMQFVYDYAYCRTGPTRYQRSHNFVLKFPLLDSKTFLKNNPNNPATKSCNWYLLADGFEFSDIYINNNE